MSVQTAFAARKLNDSFIKRKPHMPNMEDILIPIALETTVQPNSTTTTVQPKAQYNYHSTTETTVQPNSTTNKSWRLLPIQ